MRIIEGGVTAATGFTAAGVHCGIKPNKKDLALIVSDCPATVAAMFTTNQFAAPPVVFDRTQLAHSKICSAIVVNKGVANACTGERGLRDAQAMAAQTAAVLNLPLAQVLVASTGVIGRFLPMDKVSQGIVAAAQQLAKEHHGDAMAAIMTTDTKPKEYALEIATARGTYHLGGMAKGSGMMKPNMATMLVFLTTDALLAPELLDAVLRQAVNQSFHRISVDNDTSTNDSVFLLANGQAGIEILPDSPEYAQFCEALNALCIQLAKMLVKDGEGTTKLIEIQIRNAATPEDALLGARAIADSYLVKTAIFGKDPNWGRIACALGYSGMKVIPENTAIAINGLPVLDRNLQVVGNETALRASLVQDEIIIAVDLGVGTAATTFWTSDLSYEYVKINAEYTT
jgi:glutamate N-acetyltransferase / amino-acid N-acetyltransferase